MDINFALHEAQLEILNSTARFKVAACGRRFGKSFLAAVLLLIYGMQTEGRNGKSLELEDILYVAPTFENAKHNIWKALKVLGKDLITNTVENTATATLVNGRTIRLKGADNPDSLRGLGCSLVVLDEYATMKPEVWDEIIAPMLMTSQGDALFIGTPKGKNHFYEVFLQATQDTEGRWEAFSFSSDSNPYVSESELLSTVKNMSKESAHQELKASFKSVGKGKFKDKLIYDTKEPKGGDFYITVDLAGFEDASTSKKSKSKLAKLDDTVINVVKAGTYGWYVKEMIVGKWGTRETAIRIMKAVRKYKPLSVGIEQGALKNAVEPYLEDYKRRFSVYPVIVPLKHNKQKKTNRILWALQGRFEAERIVLNEGDWNEKFEEQYNDFPDPLTHDDLLDALAYTDQLAKVVYEEIDNDQDDFEVLDDEIGF